MKIIKDFFQSHCQQSHIRNNKGNAALMIFALISVLTILLEFEFSKNSNTAKALSIYRLKNSKDFLALQTQANAQDPAVFRSTLVSSGTTLNVELKNCIFGTGPSACIAETEYPVTLFYPMPNSSASYDPMSIPWNSPGVTPAAAAAKVYYDTKGIACAGLTSPSALCPISILTKFKAHCAGGAASCTKAESLQVHYLIQTESPFANQFSVLDVDRSSKLILVNDILPPIIGANTQNIAVNTISVTTTTPPTTLASTTPVYDPALLALISANGFTSTKAINKLAAALTNAGITNQNVINAILTAEWNLYQNSPQTDVISVVGALNTSDPALASLMVNANVDNLAWATVVAGSTVTDPHIIQLLGYQDVTSSAMVNQLAAAVAGITDPNAADAILMSAVVTSPASAAALAAALAGTQNPGLASVAIKSLGPNANPATVLQIVNATSGIADASISTTLAWYQVTNASLANNLASIVSVIPNSDLATRYAVAGITDPSITQGLVNAYIANPPAPPVANNSNGSSSTSTSSSSGSGGSTSGSNSGTGSSSSSGTGPNGTSSSSSTVASATTSTSTSGGSTNTNSGSSSIISNGSTTIQNTQLITNCLAGQCSTPVL